MKNKFAKGMLIYALVVLVIFAAVLFVFSGFLKSYEKSQTSYAIKEYIDTISDEEISKLTAPIIASLSDLQDSSFLNQKILEDIKSSTPVRGKSESENSVLYYLKNGNAYIEKLTLTPGNDCGFGFKSWSVSSSELLAESLAKSVSILVPPEYTVFVDGQKLGGQYITDDKLEYELLKGFYKSDEFKCPYLVSYYTGSLFNDTEIKVLDGDGKEVPIDNLNEDYYSDNCTEQEKQDITQFINEYVAAYVKLTSNADYNYELNYFHLMKYVYSDSDLHQRFRELMKSVSFNSSNGDELTDITVNHIMNCGGGNYMCDVSYTYNTTGQGKVKTTNTNNERLMLRQSSTGAYQAEYLVTY